MSEINIERALTEAKRLESEQSQTTGSTHPICQQATDQVKCERFAERLEDASNNIDPQNT